MCFSASASFVAGGALSATGVATLKKAKKKSELPFASLPLLFGIQQTIEGIIWLTISNASSLMTTMLTFLYSVYAYAFWPVFVPFAVRLMETDPSRKRILSILSSIGFAVGLYLFYFILRYPVTAAVVHQSIAYTQVVPFGTEFFWVYLGVTTLSCFLSSHRFVRLFGFLILLFVPVSNYIHETSFVSTWCFSAAILSFIVYLHFHYTTHKEKSVN